MPDVFFIAFSILLLLAFVRLITVIGAQGAAAGIAETVFLFPAAVFVIPGSVIGAQNTAASQLLSAAMRWAHSSPIPAFQRGRLLASSHPSATLPHPVTALRGTIYNKVWPSRGTVLA